MTQASQYEQVKSAIIAAGTDGIDLTALRSLLWPVDAPQNWRVIIAMRVTKARKKDGLNVGCNGGRYRLLPEMAEG